MTKFIVALSISVMWASSAHAQTNPTQAEKDEWAKEPTARILETSPCKQITWMVESERKEAAELSKQPILYALGWWGRGFIEGAVSGPRRQSHEGSNGFRFERRGCRGAHHDLLLRTSDGDAIYRHSSAAAHDFENGAVGITRPLDYLMAVTD